MGQDPIKAAISSSRALIAKSYELLRTTSLAGAAKFPRRPEGSTLDGALPRSDVNGPENPARAKG